MTEFVRYLISQTASAAITFASCIISNLEWYSHSTDIKEWLNSGRYSAKSAYLLFDDDEESVEDYSVYFNEYDWETEKKESIR